MSTKSSVLVVDDEPSVLKAFSVILADDYDLTICNSGTQAMEILLESNVDILITDINMPELKGIELLEYVKNNSPEIEVIIMSAFGTAHTAFEALKAGASDFITKPISSVESIPIIVEKAIERKRLVDRNRELEQQLEVQGRYQDLLGTSDKMREVFQLIESVSYSDSNILIQGESGTGKELVARALHYRGARKDKNFVVINCSALTETLLETELFGHMKGSFTGATADKPGLFEAAHTGTIFLDEIGDIPPSTQVKLLRVLQQGEVKRVGSNDIINVDVRCITATNVDLYQAIQDNRFREDLYYRLNVININLPPLRDRPDDIPLLAYHFMKKYALKMNKETQRIEQEMMDALLAYRWVGNVRELENVIERSIVLSRGEELLAKDLPPNITKVSMSRDISAPDLSHLTYKNGKSLAVQTFEKRYLASLLKKHSGNISAASRQAGLDRSNFRRILKKYDMC